MKDKLCLIQGTKTMTYSQLWERIDLLADAFLKIGIKENDKIAIILPNCKEFIHAFYALCRINAVSVPLNQSLTSHELKKVFDDCDPKGIVTVSGLYEKKISSIMGSGKIIIFVDRGEDVKTSHHSFRELLKIGKAGNLPCARSSNDRVATINYTYRGLGRPLGAVLTHGNYHHGAMGYVRLTEFLTTQRVLLVTPMSHIFTLVSCVIVPLLRGSTVVIMKSSIPSHIFKAIGENRIDFIIAVPTVYISLLKNYRKSFDISSLRYGITGGSYMPPEVYKEIKEKMKIELLQGYGLTETMPITCNPRLRYKPESLGVPGHEVGLKIVDGNGRELSRGQKGEILVGGPTVMKGYYNKNGENEKYLRDGWFYTGDYGWMDKEGYLYFDSLKKEIVKVGGNNVDLKEVTEALASFPGAREVKLDIIKDSLWGSLLQAEVGMDSKKEITEKEIKSFCRERLAIYKIPRKILVKKAI